MNVKITVAVVFTLALIFLIETLAVLAWA